MGPTVAPCAVLRFPVTFEAAERIALTSSSVSPLPLSFCGFPNLMVMPMTGLVVSFRFGHGPSKQGLEPREVAVLTVLAEMAFPCES